MKSVLYERLSLSRRVDPLLEVPLYLTVFLTSKSTHCAVIVVVVVDDDDDSTRPPWSPWCLSVLTW